MINLLILAKTSFKYANKWRVALFTAGFMISTGLALAGPMLFGRAISSLDLSTPPPTPSI